LPAKPPQPAGALIETQADEEDESITTTAPAPRINAHASLPLTVPGVVQIREMPEALDDDEPLEETEVRTLVTAPGEPDVEVAPSPAATAGPLVSEADEADDSVTTQSPTTVKHARLPEDDEKETAPRAPRPIPAAGRSPGEEIGYKHERPLASASRPDAPSDAYDSDESVTTRGPAVEYEDDSVTAQAPVTRPLHTDPRAGARASEVEAPADEEGESITTRAPSHLTNMLRVIATSDAIDDDNEPPENKTAVMLNAPVKPVNAAPAAAGGRAARAVMTSSGLSGSARAAAIADMREPSSDSGLRITRAEAPSGDHASINVLMAGGQFEHGPGAPHALLADPRGRDASAAAFANAEQHAWNASHGPQAGLRDVDFGGGAKKPRYGLLVGLVALLSFAIPLALFLWLQQVAAESASDGPPRAPSEVASDRVALDPPRGKAPKATPSASASASSSSSAPRGGAGSRWFPRRR
jgi:hypothetical protein